MEALQSGFREIEWDDAVTCPECAHTNNLFEVLVRGWLSEKEPEETEVQFLSRFFNIDEDRRTKGDAECVCGEPLHWVSPKGTIDVELVE